MDRHAEWIDAQHELSEASRAAHYWNTMPRDLRSRLGVGQYRERRAAARQRLKRADKICRNASVVHRIAMRLQTRA